ncbi:MAG: hypothetical protein Tsb004_18410 [Allomuricauda sp.]
MQAQAIDNRAMNYKNAHQAFRVEKFEMNVQDDHIQVRIASPLLQANNHIVDIKNNKLQLRLIEHRSNNKSIPLPLICDLYLPADGYNAIGKQTFENGMLNLKIFKSSIKEDAAQNLVQHIA